MHIKKEIIKLQNKINKLKRKNIKLIISDFDDTIFSRDEQKEKSILFKKYSNISSTDVVFKHYWLDNFINTYFKNKDYPKNISSKLKINQDLILTAWKKELQEAKLKILNLDKINYIIVDNPIDKIKYFKKYKKIIEKTLNTKLNIIEVKMDWNKNYKSLTKK